MPAGGLGLALTTTDARGHRREQDRDLFGRLTRVVEWSGNGGGEGAYAPYATYSYSMLDLLTGVTDAANNTTLIGYDSLGRKTNMGDPDMGAWAYSYNVNGNLLTQTDAKQQTITFSYDALDRLTGKTYAPAGVVLQELRPLRLRENSGMWRPVAYRSGSQAKGSIDEPHLTANIPFACALGTCLAFGRQGVEAWADHECRPRIHA